ncbi:MBL fold metallo-hydrolase [Puniceibacterium sp. IMCC21224]|uniref:MBL fold metallo-hydrolase n=1 Tax=Puniceibacterium sp. IMCC21224 TaxID=1618204 RepID=UPI00064DFE0C|nr:MBL fold metallo-hydrolase [Puniceibacterium sp. IMCC21224]KMK66972.1 Zn-dependent hydrolase, glyoxylase [Puniceibacterium sp. IMCC21224]
MQDPDPSFRPQHGLTDTLRPGLRRIVAPNPSAMTFRGTNTYLLGERALAVIDPGPDDPTHLAAILAALKPGQSISHIIVTHAHRDHSPLSRALSRATGAPVLAFGDAQAGRSAVMQRLADSGLMEGGEGVDFAFMPDIAVPDGAVISGDGWDLEVLHTPGHFGNHIALGWGQQLFCGDLVMGWATSLVSPPDGDLTDFMASCARVRAGNWARLHPGHGAPINEPLTRIDWLISHRQSREAQILAALGSGPADAATLAAQIYTEIPPDLLPAAARNTLAHLVDLVTKSKVVHNGSLRSTSRFQLS